MKENLLYLNILLKIIQIICLVILIRILLKKLREN